MSTPKTGAQLAAEEITTQFGGMGDRVPATLIQAVAAIISKHCQQPLPVSETPRDGNWMDAFGACKVCNGGIPHGHANNCDIYKLEMDVATERAAREAAELKSGDVAKALNAYPDSNLVSLATTLEATRRKAEAVFPLVETMRDALEACVSAVREHGGHGTPTVDRAEWIIAHNMADAALALVPANPPQVDAPNKWEEVAEEYETALREIFMLCGNSDPSDGEGTEAKEVANAVKAALTNLPAEKRIAGFASMLGATDAEIESAGFDASEFVERRIAHFQELLALSYGANFDARKSQPGVNDELKKCLWLMLDGTRPDYSDSRSSLSTRQSDINRAWKAYETAESAAPGENLEVEIKTLKYAASICDSKNLLFKNVGYRAACDEIKTCLLASVERLEAGEQMESTATVSARKTEGAK